VIIDCPTQDLLLNGYSYGLQKTCDAVTVARISLDPGRKNRFITDILLGTELDKLNGCLEESQTFASMGVSSKILPSNCRGSHGSFLIISNGQIPGVPDEHTSASKTLTRHPARRKEAICVAGTRYPQ
jgi:hypothetical protein